MNKSIGLSFISITLTWLIIFTIAYFIFNQYVENENNPNSNIIANTLGAKELILKRNRLGHYIAPGIINNEPVNFLLDTGATFVSVPAHQGKKLGLLPGAYGKTQTANGEANIRFTTINSLILGPFKINNVQAVLNPGQKDDQILLGMSVLKKVEFKQDGKNLILKLQNP